MTANGASIVIPLLRQPDDWLRQCVLSAMRQTVPVEVVVVTCQDTPASNIDLLDALARRHPLRRIPESPRRGLAHALNTGILAAATERVGFLLADDWLHPRAVEKCLRYDSDIVSSQVSNYAADGANPLGICRRITLQGYLRRTTHQARVDYLSHFYLFRRDALLDVGGVDPNVGETGADDYDLIWTLLERGAAVNIVEEILYYKCDHRGERLTLRDPARQTADLEKIFDKHGVHGELRRRLISRHAQWFGRPIHEVVQDRAGKMQHKA